MINNFPLVSVIVPVYKVEQYIHRAIDSLLHQTYHNLEIILVDDGSPDDCPAICDKYAIQDKRVRVIHKPNGGLSDARNAALDIMTGQYVTFVDSDDYVADNMIELFVKAAKLHHCSIVAAGMNIIDKYNQIYDYRRIQTSKLSMGSEITKNLLQDKFPFNFVCAKFFRSSIFANIRFPLGRYYEDTAITYQLTAKCKTIYCMAECLYFYELGREGNITSELSSKKAAKSYIDGCKNSQEQILFCQTNKEYSEMLPIVSKRLQLWALLAMQSATGLNYKEFIYYHFQVKTYLYPFKNTKQKKSLRIAQTLPIFFYFFYPLLAKLKKI